MKSFEHYTTQLLDMWPQKLVISGVCSAVCSFFYADAMLVWIYVLTFLADFVVGMMRGIKLDGCLDGAKLRQGGVKAVMYCAYLLVIGAAGVSINRFLDLAGLPNIPVMNGFLVYFTCTELSSIVKKFEEMGLKVPPLLKLFLSKSTQRAEQEVSKIYQERPDYVDYTPRRGEGGIDRTDREDCDERAPRADRDLR